MRSILLCCAAISILAGCSTSSSSSPTGNSNVSAADKAHQIKLTGFGQDSSVSTHTVQLHGSTSNLLGDSGYAVVTNSMGQTRTELDVSGGTYYQSVDLSHGSNQVTVVILQGATVVDQSTTTVNSTAAIVPLRLRLSWNQPYADVDLHVVSPSGEESYYDNKDITDGSLDYDDVDGYGPETFSLNNPRSGVYTVSVVYYDNNGLTASLVAQVQASIDEGPWQPLGNAVTLVPSQVSTTTKFPIGTATIP